MTPSLCVLWLRQDLRLDDNALWQLATQRRLPLLVLYILPAHWSGTDEFGLQRLAPPKRDFLYARLRELGTALSSQGHTLCSVCAEPVHLITALHAIEPLCVVSASAQAPEELAWFAALTEQGIRVIHSDTQTLYTDKMLKPQLSAFPASFSLFKRSLSPLTVPAPAPSPDLRAIPAAEIPPWLQAMRFEPDAPDSSWPPVDAWLAEYFTTRAAIAHYKATRNQLSGRYFSSHMSPYLAWGALSVRRLWQWIEDYQHQHGACEHSEWLKQELLWREYFHWSMRHHQRRLFQAAGIGRRQPPSRFNPDWWRAWCNANTGMPMIDAGLQELKRSGFVSNRLRQNMASYFIHQLGLDWRLGARFFEQYLLDFDVASNQGNWAYIAGCGHDPRGGRQFDLNWQLQHYDPALAHLRKWLPELAHVSLERVLSHQRGDTLIAGYPAPIHLRRNQSLQFC